MIFYLLITLALLVVPVVYLLILRGRLEELEARIREVDRAKPSYAELENLLYRMRPAEPAPPPPPTPAAKAPEAPPAPEEVPVAATATLEPEPEPVPLQLVVEPAPSSMFKRFNNQEWEALLGGNILNKIGALLLVVGVALFLGYSFGHVGPAGRAVFAVVLSSALLLTGVWAEKRPRFDVFSRGLIGAGWAALYATAYAIYAVPAARIIDNPFVGSVLLLVVACGMVAHSLRYRVQAITGMAYFAAFAALAITPATPFAVLSLIPLAASLLYLAWKFDWYAMAAAGAAATYLTCLSKGDSHAALAGTQILLLAYWLLFEAFDLLRMRRRAISNGVEWIFPANAAGFLGVSFLAWSTHAPGELWLASAYASMLYLASASLHALVRPPSSFEPAESLATRLRAGSFEGAILISALLAGLSIFGRVEGVWSSFGIALEAELIYLAGVVFGSTFLRRLGARAFAVSLWRLTATAHFEARTTVLQHSFYNWSPAVLLHAVFFYFNRAIRREGVLFSSFASALVGFVVAVEAGLEWSGVACALFGMSLLQLGLWRNLLEFRVQGYVLAGIGSAWTIVLMLMVGQQPWIAPAICLALAYSVALQTRWFKARFTHADEGKFVAYGSAAATAVFSALLTRREVPVEYLGAAWCLLSVVLLELGLRRLPAELSRFFLPVSGLAVAAMGVTHLADLHHSPPMAIWATYLAAFLAWSGAAVRLASKGKSRERDIACVLGVVSGSTLVWLAAPLPLILLGWTLIALALFELARKFALPVLILLGTSELAAAYLHAMTVDLNSAGRLWNIPVFIAALYWLGARYRLIGYPAFSRIAAWSALGPLLGLPFVEAEQSAALPWAFTALALLSYGTLRNDRDFRRQSYLVSALALLATLCLDLSKAHLLISLPVVGILYAERFMARAEHEKRMPMLFSLSATILLAAILYNCVSGGLLTVAWGIEGMVLLGVGFPLRDRNFRLQGLGLLLACTLKLFLYDLRNLETPYRIVSFIVLGLILLAVSWVYSRFREQVNKIL